ncbi:MAG: RraA family protein [Herbaspirillum sp.]|nr:RraA family protein [Herbaspirillum sp.]
MSVSSTIVNPVTPAAPGDLLDAFSNIPVSHLSDNLLRLSGAGHLRRIHGGRKLLGTAVTVKVRPGDNLVIYKALMMMSPRHVLVVDGGGDISNALVGELIMLYAIERGCTGFVIDGAVRDSAAFVTADFPCYARTVNHRGPYKNGPGQINVPVSIGGQVIQPGDIVVGDEDGVVSFAQASAAALLEAAHKTAAMEDAIKAEIATGKCEQSWLERTLRPHGLL